MPAVRRQAAAGAQRTGTGDGVWAVTTWLPGRRGFGMTCTSGRPLSTRRSVRLWFWPAWRDASHTGSANSPRYGQHQYRPCRGDVVVIA